MKIRITENKLREMVKETILNVFNSFENEPLRVEDYFDISTLTNDKIKSITNDMCALIGGQGYSSNLSVNGELLFKEDITKVMPIKQVRKELQKIGIKQWQIKTQVYANKVRVVILYADVSSNTKIIENKMLSYGWTKVRISEPTIIHGTNVRVMDFDPMEQKSLTKETIPAEAIELLGEIYYTDKNSYQGETINFLK